METLVILQIVTIALSLISLFTSYIIKYVETKKDNKSEVFSEKLVNNLHILRESVSTILTICNPATLREAKVSAKKGLYVIKYPTAEMAACIGKVKSIFFPFYPQENNFIVSLETLYYVMVKYNDDPTEENEEILKRQVRHVYLEYAVYDKAMWDAVLRQMTKSDFSAFSFDEYYEKLASSMKIVKMKERIKLYTRKGQDGFIKNSEVNKLQKTQKPVTSKTIHLPDYWFLCDISKIASNLCLNSKKEKQVNRFYLFFGLIKIQVFIYSFIYKW